MKNDHEVSPLPHGETALPYEMMRVDLNPRNLISTSEDKYLSCPPPNWWLEPKPEVISELCRDCKAKAACDVYVRGFYRPMAKFKILRGTVKLISEHGKDMACLVEVKTGDHRFSLRRLK